MLDEDHGGMQEFELDALTTIFDCNPEEILEAAETYETMSLNAWAKRENIPVTRAKDLFVLEVLDGAFWTDFCLLVPKNIFAPKNSKQLVTMAKKRPKYGNYNWDRFHINFSKIMDEKGISNISLATQLEVVATTVSHWRTGIRKPSESKLEMIAQICNCDINDLIDKSEV